jgi:arginase
MAKAADLIIVPFDCASRAVRMGLGPQALLDAGVATLLEEEGVDCRIVPVEPERQFKAEIATTFDLHRAIRRAVEASVAAGRRPITLSGNCNLGVIGSLAADGAADAGLFWFDAHSDAETPETSTSGFLDGMGLAMTLGACWRPMLDASGARPLAGRRAVLVGAREVSPAAGALLAERQVTIVAPREALGQSPEEALAGAVGTLRAEGVGRVHVHVDLDVLDPDAVGPANEYALPGGLTGAQLDALLTLIAERFEIVSASVGPRSPAIRLSPGADAETLPCCRPRG